MMFNHQLADVVNQFDINPFGGIRDSKLTIFDCMCCAGIYISWASAGRGKGGGGHFPPLLENLKCETITWKMQNE